MKMHYSIEVRYVKGYGLLPYCQKFLNRAKKNLQPMQ